MKNTKLCSVCVVALMLFGSQHLLGQPQTQSDRQAPAKNQQPDDAKQHLEKMDDLPASPAEINKSRHGALGQQSPLLSFGNFSSVQVNVDANGNNIPGDAANEPSITLNPLDPDNIVIGWRQFDTIVSNFRQAGNAHSFDAGMSWTNPLPLDAGVFRSDPVLAADSAGNIYYYSLTIDNQNDFVCDMFISDDGGVSWTAPIPAGGGDKQWFGIDRTGGVGDGNVYAVWSPFFSCCPSGFFTSSTDGVNYLTPLPLPEDIYWGTVSVGPDGELYVCGRDIDNDPWVVRSDNAMNGGVPTFPQSVQVDLGGNSVFGNGPNPGGLLGQYDIETDHSDGDTRGNVYLLASVNPPGSDPCNVMFARSIDGGVSWTNPMKINTDPNGGGRFNWFGTMSVAPCGRIDVIWNDQRNNPGSDFSAMFYRSSHDGGVTWGPELQVTNEFNSLLGHPNQNKIGDYYDMRSTDDAVHVAYSATFNGEQDVYYLRIELEEELALESFDVSVGALQSGGLPELEESDNERVVIVNDLEDGAQMIVETTAENSNPCALSVTLESSVLTVSGFITQEIELFDFDSGQYVSVDSGNAGSSDTIVTVEVTDDPSRYIESGTGTVRARLTWENGIVVALRQWILTVDHVQISITN